MRVINSYSDNEGNLRASCLGQPVLEEYAPYTLGNYAAIITRNEKDVYERVQAFLEKIGYRGFSNIDMKYDAKSGRYLMFEINPRLGRSSFYVIGACTAASILIVQVILNALGTVDVVPLTGVTFPFVSNGGSSMLGAWGLLAFVKAADTRQNASFAVRLTKRGGYEDE